MTPVQCRASRSGHPGFSLIEAVIVVFIGAMVLATTYQLLSSGTRSSLKGQADLETIRSGSQLLNEMKKDLLASRALKMPPGSEYSLEPGETKLPSLPPSANQVVFLTGTATITYALESQPGGGASVKRTEEAITEGGRATRQKSFGAQRITDFRVARILKKQQIQDADIVGELQLLVCLEMDSSDERFSSRKFSWNSFLISPQMSSGQWKSY